MGSNRKFAVKIGKNPNDKNNYVSCQALHSVFEERSSSCEPFLLNTYQSGNSVLGPAETYLTSRCGCCGTGSGMAPRILLLTFL